MSIPVGILAYLHNLNCLIDGEPLINEGGLNFPTFALIVSRVEFFIEYMSMDRNH
jgi:hypothetical protein